MSLHSHVHSLRSICGLPVGRPTEWEDGMTLPVTTLPPTDAVVDVSKNFFPIHTMSYWEYFDMPATFMQSLFRKYHVVVVEDQPTRLKCDIDSLEEWGDPDELRVMHGELFSENVSYPSQLFHR